MSSKKYNNIDKTIIGIRKLRFGGFWFKLSAG